MKSPSGQMGTEMIACGLDFGTSNSAIGVVRDSGLGEFRFEAGADFARWVFNCRRVRFLFRVIAF